MQMFPSEDHANGPHQTRKRQLSFRIVVFLIVTSLLVAVSSLGLFGKSSTAKAATWTQTWSDEFNGSAGTAPSGSNWLYDLGTSYPGGAGNWGTGEVETNTNSTNNVYLDGNGHLAIKPIRDASGNWTSGRIETQNTGFAAPVGGELAIEASIQMPNVTGASALGYWPAFWMLGSAFRGVYTNWPGIGEVDIMENINGLNKEYGTLHCGVDPGGPCNETTGLGGNTPCAGTTCQAGFHTYRVEIDRSISPEQIRCYLDGVQFWQVSASSMDATTWANAVDHSFFIILNVAMGGAFPNAICGCTSPSSATASGIPMLVDYVRAYTSGGSTGGVTPTPTPTGSTPTPTPTPSTGSGFSQGATSTSANQAQLWFQPSGWTAGYVILHYTAAGSTQQNVNMAYNSGTSRWEYTAGGISAGKGVTYSFTYQRNGLQYDTGSYSWTHP